MEGKKVFEETYKELDKIFRNNTGSNTVTIDYTKMDQVTQSILRDAIHCAVCARKREVFQVIQGIQ